MNDLEFEKYQKENRNYFLKFLFLRVKNKEDQEDIEIDFWRAVAKMEITEENFNSNFLKGILTNIIRNYYRSKKGTYTEALTGREIENSEKEYFNTLALTDREQIFFELFQELQGKSNEKNSFIKKTIEERLGVKDSQYYNYLNAVRNKLK
jgi:hypothetical protein